MKPVVAMFPASAKHGKRAQRRLQPALLAGAALLALAAALPAAAQDGAPIRGAVDENAINDELLDRTPLIGRGLPIPQRPAPGADAQQPQPPYQPATPSDAEELAGRPPRPGRSLFEEPPPADEDIFEDRPLPIEPLSPTARRRAENQRIGAPNQPDQDAEEPTGAGRAARARDVAGGAEADEEALDALATGTIRTGPIDAEIDRRLDPGVEPVEAIEDLDRAPDLDPYAPLGLRLGSFIVRPSVETGLTATSNANSSPDGGSAVLSESTLRLTAASDWATNSATLDAFGNFRESISGEEVSETFAGVTGTCAAQQVGHLERAGRGARQGGPPVGAARAQVRRRVELEHADITKLTATGWTPQPRPTPSRTSPPNRSSRHWSATSASRRRWARRASESPAMSIANGSATPSWRRAKRSPRPIATTRWRP